MRKKYVPPGVSVTYKGTAQVPKLNCKYTLDITYPASGTVLSDASFKIKGTSNAPTGTKISLLVGGIQQTAVVVSGFWSYDVVDFGGETDSMYRIVASVMDEDFVRETRSVTFFYDFGVPSTPVLELETETIDTSSTRFVVENMTSFEVSWGPSTIRNGENLVSKYFVYLNGVLYKDVNHIPATTKYSCEFTNLLPGTEYEVEVVAESDSTPEKSSAPSVPINVETNKDEVAPTVPTGSNIISFVRSSTDIDSGTLTWNKFTDNHKYTQDNGGVDIAVDAIKSYLIELEKLNPAGTTKHYTVDTYDDASQKYSNSENYTYLLSDLTQGLYRVKVYAIDYSDNKSNALSLDFTIEKPQTPVFSFSGETSTGFTLNWGASAAYGTINAQSYNIYLNGVLYAYDIQSTSYVVAGLIPNKTYYIAMSSVDSAGNESQISAALTKTLLDTVAPTAPSGLAAAPANITDTGLRLTWTAPADNPGGSGIKGYRVYRGTSEIGTTSSTQFDVTGLTQYTDYSFTVKAEDYAGNLSAVSTALSVKTKDGISPSVPTDLAATTVSATQVILVWSGATDNVGVTAYDVYNGTTLIGTVSGSGGSAPATTYTAGSLSPWTEYTFTVKAKDAAGNVSNASAAKTVKTKDNVPPTIPQNLKATNVNSTGFTLSWESSYDLQSGVKEYEIFILDNKIATVTAPVTSYAVTGLATATPYQFTVKAKDNDGNTSNASAILNVVTS